MAKTPAIPNNMPIIFNKILGIYFQALPQLMTRLPIHFKFLKYEQS